MSVHLDSCNSALQAEPASQHGAWVSVEDRLPEIPSDVPSYAANVPVLVVAGTGNGSVRPMRYARNMYAKTEKGRAARWEEWDGRIAFSQPTFWMPLPPPPAQSQPAGAARQGGVTKHKEVKP